MNFTDMTLTVTGDVEIQARFRSIAPAFINDAIRAIERVSTDCVRYIVDGELAGVMLNRQSGRLADSIFPIPAVAVPEAGLITAGVEQRDSVAPYGKWHEYGATIPELFGNPVMRWIDADTGNPVFARHTRAHVLVPTPFMQRAAMLFDKEYRDAVEVAVDQSLRDSHMEASR